jgi:ABC-type multidrug transport system ATPase subunit
VQSSPRQLIGCIVSTLSGAPYVAFPRIVLAGAGKTSLLNALCGRAFYGAVEGKIWINGIQASIEEHKDAVGFVPQDDTVYAELTVKENLMYSGKFRSERNTDILDIEDYADVILAKLGLARVANTIVGDVTRRGVSGGEKKRVNIGIELMGKVCSCLCRVISRRSSFLTSPHPASMPALLCL